MTVPRRDNNPLCSWGAGFLGAALLLAAMIPQAAFAIVETAGTVSTGTGVNVDTVNVTHTVPAGSDRYLIVGVSKNGGAGVGTITGAVWNDGSTDQALAELGTVNHNNRRVSIFGLVAPNVAINGTVTVTLSAADMRSVVGVVNLIGVNQTTPGEDFFSASSGAPPPATATVNICPTAAGNCPMEAGDLAIAVLGTRGNTGAITIDPIVPATISFDAASQSDGATVSSISWSHTIGPANVRKLVVGVMVEQDSGGISNCASVGNADVTNVTFNSVSMTHIPGADSCVQSANNFMARVEMWYMDQADLPLNGTYTIQATMAGTVREVDVGAVSLDNAAQGAPEAVATNTIDGGGDVISTNIALGTPDAWLIDTVVSGNPGNFTAGAGQLERVDTSNFSATGAMSTKAGIAAGANSMAQTYNTGANRLAHAVLRIAPHCAGGCSQTPLWNLQTGATSNQSTGVAWAQGGAGETFMTANLTTAQSWALGAVLIKQVTFVTQAVIDGMRAWSHGSGAIVEWETLAEYGTLGFHLQRLDPESGKFERINERLLPGLLHSRTGGIYRYYDEDAVLGETYVYRIVEIESTGKRNRYGPYQVTVDSFSGFVDPGAASDRPVDRYERVLRSASTASKQRLARKQVARAKARARRARRRGPSAKISVRETGLYQLDATRIAATLGISDAQVRRLIHDRSFVLRNRGKPVATLGASDDAALYFYGEAIESQYTEDNVYVLRTGKGRFMGRVDGGGATPVPAQSFLYTSHAEGNRFTLTHLFDDPDGDYWMWDFRIGGMLFDDCETVTPPTPCNITRFPVLTPDVARGAVDEAELVVRLHGASDPEGTDDHRVTVSINGDALGAVVFDGLSPFEARFKVPLSQLLDGENIVQVDAQAPADSMQMSVMYVNDMALRYPRRQVARAGMLAVDTAGRRAVTVGGFGFSDVLLLDVSDAREPKVVEHTFIDQGADGYRVSASLGEESQRVLAVARGRALAVNDIVADVPSRLRRRRNRADWLLITTADLMAAGEVLAGHRRTQGLRTMVVDVEDVYDEFNHGIRSADAIWRFLRYVHTRWSQKPRYAVLAGEGSHDYKNYLGHGDSLIPSLLTPTPNGLFPSDNLFADVDGNDWVPEIAIGRLPVIDAAELEVVVDKIIAYERNTDIDGWGRRVLVSADAAEELANFAADSDVVVNNIPVEFAVNRVYVDDLGELEARNRMLADLAAGSAYVNFYGHGGHLSMGNFRPGLLTAGDVATLGNGKRLPVVTAFTCLAGQFGFPGQESVSELLMVTSGGGAVAVWAPSGLSEHDQARILGEAFYGNAFGSAHRSVGETIARAQRRFARNREDRYLLDIYNLIGDPATNVK